MTRLRSFFSVVVVVGCSGDAPSTSDASVSDDAAIDAASLPLPPGMVSLQFSPDGVDVFATTATTEDIITVGARRTATGDLKDGVILRHRGFTASGWFVGGTQNDQLYAASTHGTDLLAVGMTRSFRGAAQQDQGMVVYHDGTAAAGTFQIGRYYLAADQAIQLRAVAPHNTGWVIGGIHQGGARALVVLANAGGTPQRTASFAVPGASSEVRVRRVLSSGDRVYVVGHATEASIGVGFVAAFDATNLTPVWTRLLTAADSVTLRDALLDGTTLRIVGAIANDGLAIDLETTTGTSTLTRVIPARALTTVAALGGATWVAGDTGTGALVGLLDNVSLRGITLPDVEVSTLGPQSLIAVDTQVSLVVGVAGSALTVPLNATPTAACMDAPFGTPVTAPALVTPDVTNAMVTATTTMPALQFERPAAATTTVLPLNASNPCTLF